MLYHRLDFAHWYRRSPYGERGLKCVEGGCRYWNSGSLSLRRAWIEIRETFNPSSRVMVALLTESVD